LTLTTTYQMHRFHKVKLEMRVIINGLGLWSLMEEVRKIIILEFKWSLYRNTNKVSSKLEHGLVSV
jgi:hypothetical protein